MQSTSETTSPEPAWKAETRAHLARHLLPDGSDYLRGCLELILQSGLYDLFITLRLNLAAPKSALEQRLGRFAAFLDREILGRKWHIKPSSERTFFIGIIERDRGAADSYHAHILLRIPPSARAISQWKWPYIVKRCVEHSKAVAPAGEVCTLSVDQARFPILACYCVKSVDRDDDALILSDAFHRKSNPVATSTTRPI